MSTATAVAPIEVSLTPSQLLPFLVRAIKARKPVLIVSPPGCGKSDLMAEAARLANADSILSHPVVSDPTDAKGMPWIQAGADHASFYPFGDLYKAMNAKKLTVWILDDLGQAQMATQASFMQLLLAREVNGHKLPDHVTFIAATNDRTHKAGVSGMLEPVKSRFATIVYLKPDIEDWCKWAYSKSWMPPELIGFLRTRPDLLCAFKPSNDLVNSPVPRTWANAGELLSWGLDPVTELAVLKGAVGDAAATELMGFVRLYREIPNIDSVFIDPRNAMIPTHKPAVLYAVASALAARVEKKTFGAMVTYCERLMVDFEEFAVLCVRDAIRRNPDLQQTAAFVAMQGTALGNLISGVVN